MLKMPSHPRPDRTAGRAAGSLCVDLYLTSQGNHFMAEIARMFQEGFNRLGVESSLRLDEIPTTRPEADRLQVLIAPHELFTLLLERRLRGSELKAVAAACYLLNTEQPGSRWFERAAKWAGYARGVFDINRQGVDELADRGIRAVYTPLGYAPSLEAPGNDDGTVRDVDIAFLGHRSPKRDRFLAEQAETLQAYNCRLILADVSRPRLPDSPDTVAGNARNRLLGRCKILVNVHSADRRYFEWHRVLCGMANRCLVISEKSESADPLVDGEHLVFSDLDHLVDRCEHYLRYEDQRKAIAERGYSFLKHNLGIESSCDSMLKAGAEGADGFPAAAARPLFSRAASGLRRIRWAGRAYRRALYPFLYSQPWVHRVYHPARSLYDRLTGRWSLREIQQRRRAIIQRLDRAETRLALHADAADYHLTGNARYDRAASPSVSVIVTVYNYGRYVPACLESVARSRCDDLPGGLEVLVIDDASTDESLQVVREGVRQLDVPACVVQKAWNTGLADARNLGIKLARAPYVFILDADNLVYPTCLSKLYATLRSSGSAGAYSAIKMFDDRTQCARGLISCCAWDVERLIERPYIDAMALLDRSRLLAVGGFSTELIRYGWFGCEDYDLWLKLARANQSCTFRPEILAAYRVHGSSMINVTRHYYGRLKPYLEEKFSDLLGRHPIRRLRLGRPALGRRAA